MALEISTSSWIDDETKIFFKEKLQLMKFHIGYPDYYKNKTILDHMYDGVRYSFRKKYFLSVVYMKIHKKYE